MKLPKIYYATYIGEIQCIKKFLLKCEMHFNCIAAVRKKYTLEFMTVKN